MTNCNWAVKCLFALLLWGMVAATLPAQIYEVTHSFEGPEGARPHAGLIQASNGMLYGTTLVGGANNAGTIYEISTPDVVTTLHSFSGSDGYEVFAGLVQGVDGNFYGATYEGGNELLCHETHGCGTIFQITPDGMLATLHNFDFADGALPVGGLIQGTDGNFYGTTSAGGANGNFGTIFVITPAGTLTTLHSFDYRDGFAPTAGLVQGDDGDFYGTTTGDGVKGNSSEGTIFKITPEGVLTTLHRFEGPDGELPEAGLVQGADGNFYGTTCAGGTSGGYGTVFKITPAGAFTNLHNFNGTDGSCPQAALIQGTDRNFYGTTEGLESSQPGTIFRMSPGGMLKTIYNFCTHLSHGVCKDGKHPYGQLVEVSPGNFYRTTAFGGDGSNDGTIFRLSTGSHSSAGHGPFEARR